MEILKIFFIAYSTIFVTTSFFILLSVILFFLTVVFWKSIPYQRIWKLDDEFILISDFSYYLDIFWIFLLKVIKFLFLWFLFDWRSNLNQNTKISLKNNKDLFVDYVLNKCEIKFRENKEKYWQLEIEILEKKWKNNLNFLKKIKCENIKYYIDFWIIYKYDLLVKFVKLLNEWWAIEIENIEDEKNYNFLTIEILKWILQKYQKEIIEEFYKWIKTLDIDSYNKFKIETSEIINEKENEIFNSLESIHNALNHTTENKKWLSFKESFNINDAINNIKEIEKIKV